MPAQYRTAAPARQAAVQAQALADQLASFLAPLLTWLDQTLDQRLVRTCFATVQAILAFRHPTCGLLLSELGAYLLSPAHAPAGTKRLSNLLRSPKWTSQIIARFLWQTAEARLAALEQAQEDALVVWDESVLEKPESLALEGLCAVRSSQAARLTRIKPGYYHPPAEHIFVPGMQWLALLLLGPAGPPTLATMRWWTRRGRFASDRRSQEEAVLEECHRRWAGRVLHLFDRGFAGQPWLDRLVSRQVRCVVRWPKRYHLLDGLGRERPAWQIMRGKRAWEQREVWDGRRRRWAVGGVLAAPVRHPAFPQPLWLVVSRLKGRKHPWYLLTNEPVQTATDAWRLVKAYGRRWQIEQTWRYSKSELAEESPRLWTWERRLKLLLLASLAYAFLLTLAEDRQQATRDWLFRQWCHRTGRRSREAALPLYRLRAALSRLWAAHPPHRPAWPLQNSG